MLEGRPRPAVSLIRAKEPFRAARNGAARSPELQGEAYWVDCLPSLRSNMNYCLKQKIIFEAIKDVLFRAKVLWCASGDAAACCARAAPPGTGHLGCAAHAPPEPGRPCAAHRHVVEHRQAHGGWLSRHRAAHLPARAARAGPAR